MKKLTYLLSFVCCGALAVCSQSAMAQHAASSGVLPETAEEFAPASVDPAMVRPTDSSDFRDHLEFETHMRRQSDVTFFEMMPGYGASLPQRAIDSKTRKEIESAQNLSKNLRRAMDELVNTKDDAKRTTLTSAIQKMLDEQFERDLKQREDELKKVEARLTALRAQLEKRKAAQADIVQLKLQTMVNEANGLGFPASGIDRDLWNVRGLPGLSVPVYGAPATVGPDFPRPSTGAELEPFFPGEVEPER